MIWHCIHTFELNWTVLAPHSNDCVDMKIVLKSHFHYEIPTATGYKISWATRKRKKAFGFSMNTGSCSQVAETWDTGLATVFVEILYDKRVSVEAETNKACVQLLGSYVSLLWRLEWLFSPLGAKTLLLSFPVLPWWTWTPPAGWR